MKSTWYKATLAIALLACVACGSGTGDPPVLVNTADTGVTDPDTGVMVQPDSGNSRDSGGFIDTGSPPTNDAGADVETVTDTGADQDTMSDGGFDSGSDWMMGCVPDVDGGTLPDGGSDYQGSCSTGEVCFFHVKSPTNNANICTRFCVSNSDCPVPATECGPDGYCVEY